MKIKTFIGASMADVMRQIKQELGDDAVIVSNRTQNDGSIRVSAAVEDDPVVEAVETFVDGIEDSAALFGGIRDYGDIPDSSAEEKIAVISKADHFGGRKSALQRAWTRLVQRHPLHCDTENEILFHHACSSRHHQNQEPSPDVGKSARLGVRSDIP